MVFLAFLTLLLGAILGSRLGWKGLILLALVGLVALVSFLVGNQFHTVLTNFWILVCMGYGFGAFVVS